MAKMNLAILHKDEGNPEVAKPLFEQACAGFRATFGPNHTVTLNCECELYELHAELGELQEAAAVVNTLAALRGPGGPAAANNLYEAYCASAVGLLKYKQALAAEAGPAGGHGGELRREAEQLLRGALVTQRRLHGDAHPYSKKTERRLADVVGPSG